MRKLTACSLHFSVCKAMLFCIFLVCCFWSMTCFPQDSSFVSTTKKFSIKQDAKIFKLFDKYKDYNHRKEFSEGYRIQITYTDVRDEVYKSKGAMYKEFPELASYVEYEQPYYKLRLGNFRSRLEATFFLHQIVNSYPGAFIVKDKIKLK